MESLIFAVAFVTCLAFGAMALFSWFTLLVGIKKWADDKSREYAIALLMVLVLAFGTSVVSAAAAHWLLSPRTAATVQPE